MEICIDSLESARNAIDGGATRLEVCSALSEGGLTPTPGLIKGIRKYSSISIYVMLRVRGGDFVYTREEMDAMLYDLKICKDEHEVNGFVFGALDSSGRIDKTACKEIISAANSLPVTFHRAFDVTIEPPSEALETLIGLGFERILTSGQMITAEDGMELIETLTRQAADRIVVMPGGGITKDNILRVKKHTGATEFHASAKVPRKMYEKWNPGTANVIGEITVTDRELVEKMVDLLR